MSISKMNTCTGINNITALLKYNMAQGSGSVFLYHNIIVHEPDRLVITT